MKPSSSSSDVLRSRVPYLLAAILLLAVLARVAVALYLGDAVDAPANLTDQRSYHNLAVRLLAGQGFSFATGWYPFTPADAPTAHWSFLYSLYLAGVYGLLGVQPLAARLVGAVVGGLLLPWLVYRLARRLFPPGGHAGREAVALVAAGCAAVYAYLVLYAATLMTETLYIAAVVWSLERAMALAEEGTWGQAVTLGVSLGLAALLRQSILPWVLPLGVWLLWAARLRERDGRLGATAGRLVVAGLVVAVLILPFTVRNGRVYGQFLLLNSNAGYAMYSAQHPLHGTSFQEFAAAPVPPDLAGLNEAQLDRELMGRGLGFVLADPGRYLLLSLSRVRDYFEFWPTADATLLHNIGRVGSFGLFLPFMLAGIYLALRENGPRRSGADGARFCATPLALVLLFMGFYSLLHILTWAMPRYRLPVDAVALPFAALAIVRLYEWLASRRSGWDRSRIQEPESTIENR